ncbi:MAG: hypothetical protein QNJ63_11580 [Calothrix sp. MO_192.B10]|nr:hypothetical protein [Calothrix sp. MO_192.B10]
MPILPEILQISDAGQIIITLKYGCLYVYLYSIYLVLELNMLDKTNIKVTIAVQDGDLEAEELERLTVNLLQEIKDIDGVENVRQPELTKIPPGAKSLGGSILGMLQAEVSFENFKKLAGFVRERLSGKAIELEVEANGKKLKVKATNQQELVTAVEQAQKFVAGS